MRALEKTHRVAARLLGLALLASGTLVGLSGPASAEPVGLDVDYTCTTSLGPTAVVHAKVVGGLPDDSWGGRNNVPYLDPVHIDVDLELSALRPALAAAGAVRLDGDSVAALGATFTGAGRTWTAQAPLTFAPTLVGNPSGAVLRAAGGFPEQYLYPAGDYAIRLGGLTLDLRPERADGTPLGAVTATCAAPGDLLGTVRAESIIVERPVRPTQLVVATTPTTATLSWYASSWWFATKGYDVYLDGTQVAFVTDKQATLTGLAPDSQHRVKIVTRDVYNGASAKSRGLVFTTPPTR